MLDEFALFLEDLRRGQWRRALTDNRVFRSVFRTGYPSTPRQQALIMFNNVVLHLHPVRIRRESLRITYTFCLAGLSFFLFLLLTVTGVLLMFFYRLATMGLGARGVTSNGYAICALPAARRSPCAAERKTWRRPSWTQSSEWGSSATYCVRSRAACRSACGSFASSMESISMIPVAAAEGRRVFELHSTTPTLR
jgi:hypothetical protein